MTTRIGRKQKLIQITILLFICISIPLGGCTKAEPETGQRTAPAESTSPNNTATDQNNTTTEQANTGQNANNQSNSAVSNTEGLPSGVTITKVIKDISTKNNYRKKEELLSDGGKRVTITDSSGNLVTLYLEYEGIIQAVNGDKVTVQVERGGEQTLTIPKEAVIQDEDNAGLNKGVEIEWVVNSEGQVESVELEREDFD